MGLCLTTDCNKTAAKGLHTFRPLPHQCCGSRPPSIAAPDCSTTRPLASARGVGLEAEQHTRTRRLYRTFNSVRAIWIRGACAAIHAQNTHRTVRIRALLGAVGEPAGGMSENQRHAALGGTRVSVEKRQRRATHKVSFCPLENSVSLRPSLNSVMTVPLRKTACSSPPGLMYLKDEEEEGGEAAEGWRVHALRHSALLERLIRENNLLAAVGQVLLYLTVRKLDDRQPARMRGVNGLRLAVSVHHDAICKSFLHISIPEKHLAAGTLRKAASRKAFGGKRTSVEPSVLISFR